jgi:hypothetical protein
MTLDSDALHARLRPTPEALRVSFERHRAEPYVSVEAHVRRLRLAFAESVAERSAVYLEKLGVRPMYVAAAFQPAD